MKILSVAKGHAHLFNVKQICSIGQNNVGKTDHVVNDQDNNGENVAHLVTEGSKLTGYEYKIIHTSFKL